MKKIINLSILVFVSLFIFTGCEEDNGLDKKESVVKVEFNQTIEYVNNYDVTFNKYEAGKNIKKLYFTKENLSDSNNEYFVIWGKIKNTGTEKIGSFDLFNLKLIYDQKYNYDLYCVPEDGNSIQPLATSSFYCNAEVPSEVVSTTDKSLKFQLNIDNKNYELSIR